MSAFGPSIVEDQVKTNPNLKWIQSLSAGIDGLVGKEAIKVSPIPLTNVKGAFSGVLGEFVALGVLYHTKHVERFMQRKAAKKWELEAVELVSSKHMAIIGYGDIGAACAKVAKNGFGMKVTGVKRRPDQVTDEHRAYCDEIVGNDQYERVIAEADFVVGVLPRVAGVTDDFFTMDSTFSKMKNSAVFMNIGRGTTVNEEDLAKALKTNVIGGAVLDVYKKEPLVPESELWECPNLFMTPHCADQDDTFLVRAFDFLGRNLQLFVESGTANLINICDKEQGY